VGRIVDDLVDVTDAASALQFAQHYGFLKSDDKLSERRGRIFEPVADWITLAAQVRAIRRLAAFVHNGGTVDIAALELFQPYPKGHRLARFRFKPTRSQIPMLLSEVVTGLLYRADVRPVLLWDRPQQSFRVTVKTGPFAAAAILMPPSSLGLIAQNLLYEVMNIETPVACSICGTEYEPERTASALRKHYCPTCRGGREMWRRLKAAQRAKAVSDKKL
jgi:predicted RNA-binding Zn-ribbon protein involved in translation (DUF1610 family)